MQIPLNELRFGHEADPPLNVRKIDRDTRIPELAAMIETHGQLYPLKVRTIGGAPYVEDGNRRLAAQRLRAEQGKIAQDAPMECEEVSLHSLPGEVSLVAAISPVPPHEADQLQAFSALRDNGMEPAEIASRYGIEPQRVEKVLALGSLSPMILDAWRKGEFRDGVEVVRAFTLAPSLPDQERVFKKLKKAGRFWPDTIKDEFGAVTRDDSRLLNFVTPEVYEAAGGKITRDLFGDDHVISDPMLIRRLADEKLDAQVEKLVVAGWGWAAKASDLPDHARFSWYQDPKQKGAKTPQALKAKLGAIVSIGHPGELDIRYGVVKPSTAKPKPDKKKAIAKDEKSEASISKVLMQRLSRQVTVAAREALLRHPEVAMPALLAGFQCSDQPIKVRAEGMDHHGPRKAQSFEAAFKTLSIMNPKALQEAAAGAAASCVDMQNWNGGLPLAFGNLILCEALDEEFIIEAIKVFDAADFFGSAPKGFSLQCIEECESLESSKAAAKLPKEARAKRATDLAVKWGWLPGPMRTSHYHLNVGLAPVAKKKPAAKKAAAKKPARKRG